VPRSPLRRLGSRLRTRNRSGDGSSLVEVHAVPGRIVLTAMTPLDVAAWTSTDALAVVDEEASDGELGTAVTDMLERSLTAPRSVGGTVEEALLAAAQVRSHRALVTTARYVSVNRDGDGRVLMLPSAPGRGRGGWITVAREEGLVVDDPSPGGLGAALRTAIERSTTTPGRD
jgi:hypothetical protein